MICSKFLNLLIYQQLSSCHSPLSNLDAPYSVISLDDTVSDGHVECMSGCHL